MTVKLLSYGNKRSSRITKHLNPKEEKLFPSGHLDEICCADEILLMPKERVFAVFDGISRSHNPSETAQLARDTLEEMVRESKSGERDNTKRFILNASNRMHRNIIFAGSHEIKDSDDSENTHRRIIKIDSKKYHYEYEKATTFVMAIPDDEFLHIAHAGDSRIYALYSDDTLEQLTEDHYQVDHITKSLGAKMLDWLAHGEFIYNLDKLDERYISYNKIPLHQNSRSIKKILLATDGITDAVSDHDIKGVLRENNPNESVERLIDMANNNPSDEKIREYAKRSHITFEEAKSKLPGKDDMAAVVIQLEDENSESLLIRKSKYNVIFDSIKNKDPLKPSEDYTLVDKDNQIFIIADGHKCFGDKKQDNAYWIAIHYVLDYLKKHIHQDNDMKSLLEKAINGAHKQISDRSAELRKYRRERGETMPNLGKTTLDVGIIKNATLHYARVGDGILKLIRDDGNIATPFDETHALDLLEKKNEEDARHRLYNQSTHHVGSIYMPAIKYKKISLENIRNILMATDGLQYLNNNRIKDIISNVDNLSSAVNQLMVEARQNPDTRIVEIVKEEEPDTVKEEINKDDISVILIEKKKEYIPEEYQKLADRNTRLTEEKRNLQIKIEGLEDKIREYKELIEKEPEIPTSNEVKFPYDAIVKDSQQKKLTIKQEYSNYLIYYAELEQGQIMEKGGPISFGEFLSREYDKIERICSRLENASQDYNRKSIDWCSRQLKHSDEWIDIIEKSRVLESAEKPKYETEILEYKEYLKHLHDNLS